MSERNQSYETERFPTGKLRAVPWKHLAVETNESRLLVKTFFTDSSYEILIANRVSGMAWYERSTSANILQKTKEINPSVEMSINKLLQRIEEIISHRVIDTTFEFSPRGRSSTEMMRLTASVVLAGLPFVWQFDMIAVDSRVLSEHLIEPLILMTAELMQQQKALFALLRSKDKEIEDLRAQAVQSSRKKLETKAFDEETFRKDRQTSQSRAELLKNQGLIAFDIEGQQLYENITDLLLNDCVTTEIVFAGGSHAVHSADHGVNRTSTDSTPQNSPVKAKPEPIDPKEEELIRRQELEKRIAEKERESKPRKKKLKL